MFKSPHGRTQLTQNGSSPGKGTGRLLICCSSAVIHRFISSSDMHGMAWGRQLMLVLSQSALVQERCSIVPGLSGKACRRVGSSAPETWVQSLRDNLNGDLHSSADVTGFYSLLRVSGSKAFLRKVEQGMIFIPENITSYIFFVSVNISTLQKVLSLSQTPLAHMIVGKMG